MAHATLNSLYPLRVQLADGNPAVFPRAVIRDSSGSPVATVDLAHIANGLYGGSYTFLVVGYYSVVYTMFADAGYTVPSPTYDIEAEEVEVTLALDDVIWDALLDDHLGANTMGEALALVRGLLQHNYVLDNTEYNSKGLLIGGRIRVFKNKTDTDAEVNPIAVFTITGLAETAPDDMLGKHLKVTRD